MKKVQEHIADAVAKGAKIVTGGRPHALGGNFFEPTILTDVKEGMLFMSQETFGPVAPLFRFHDEEDAIRVCAWHGSSVGARFPVMHTYVTANL